jgi:hypothetical protein
VLPANCFLAQQLLSVLYRGDVVKKMASTQPNPRDSVEFWIDPPPNLAEAVRIHPNPKELIRRLVQVGLRQSVDSRQEDGAWRFQVVANPESVDVVLGDKGELTGKSVTQLELVYKIVRGIETTIDAATYLPAPMRQQRVEEFCQSLGITREYFSSVLQAWTKF